MSVNPVTITASSDIGQISNQTFQIGSVLYVLTWAVHSVIHIFSSADNGNTWVELDAGHAPTTLAQKVSWVWDGSTTLWVCSSSSVGASKVQFTPFSTLTGLWGLTTVTGNDANDTQQQQLIYRADTTIVVMGGVAGSPPNCEFFVFNTTSLGSTAWLPCGDSVNPSVTAGIFKGSGTRIWFVFVVTASAVDSLVIQSMDATSTLGSLVTVDPGSGDSGDLNQFLASSDGTTVVIAFNPLGNANFNVWTAPVSTMVFVLQTIGPFTDGIQQWAVLRSVGVSNLYVAGFTTLVQLTDSGSGFGPPVILISSVSYFFLAANDVIGSSGIVVDSEPPVAYLAPGSVTPVLARRVIAFGGYAQSLPSGVGSLCKFARRVRCQGHPKRTILTDKNYVYGSPR